MKKILSVTIVSAILGFIAPCLTVSAQEYTVDVSFMSKYVWRGAVFAQDGVLEPSFSGGMGNLSVNLWGNMDLTDENGSKSDKKLNEWDYTVDYSRACRFNENLGISFGVIGYTFPHGGGYTNEIYVGACYDIIGSPSVTIYQDVEAVDGTYASFSAGFSFPVSDLTSIDVSGAVGFGSEDMNIALYGLPDSGAGLSDALIGVSVPFKIGENYSITPSVLVTSILDKEGSDAYDADDDLDPTNLLFGLTFSAAF